MNRLPIEKRALILRCLTEGMSIRATVRLTGASKNTINKLLLDVGYWSMNFHDLTMRNLHCERIQVDEVWAFCGCKQKNATPEKLEEGQGDVWTSIAMCSKSKLVIGWMVGRRNWSSAFKLMKQLRKAVANRPQITTDAWRTYQSAISFAFNKNEVDYAQLIKRYSADLYGSYKSPERRYSPALVTGTDKKTIFGKPDEQYVSTSHIERQNLTIRMQVRRCTRLTNAFSKKLENHSCAMALHFLQYNFCRPHQTLGRGVTPAMAAGVADHVWTLEDVAERTLYWDVNIMVEPRHRIGVSLATWMPDQQEPRLTSK